MATPPTDVQVVGKVREALPTPSTLTYLATDDQRALKARFWLAYKHNPLCDEGQVTPALVEQLTGTSVQCWLSNRNFWLWFTVKDSVKQNLEVAAERASELAIHYLDPSVPLNDNARVQLIKYVLEFSGRSPPMHKVVKWADKDVADMTPDELEDFIRKRTGKLPPPPAKD